MNILEVNREAINSLCEKHKVAKLYAFGSVLSTAFNEESDVDFLVEFHIQNIDRYVTNFFTLKEGLETLFNREVDLIEYRSVSNPYFKEEIDETKSLLYESKN
ncbi:nucleotidyltransferase domain-containing protein [Algoriphagus sp. NF]|jgi:Predicted nucleotidyltransferases|uniref:nucleotidyltransferase family protein n=1 Tax=Algoriphagus sp. NF TaxID=2992756 RepID=UPI001064A8F4|nr:nucleotidyltransferase domain-containing protein [Algoriphagus sp. NF]MCR9082989.1 nucleotidyltransferase domain-containing protein [Cyclobacteriaceae bacterium]MDE0558508.1 nucleotidyltransferase domain-containing protein [Algoriphagus sp. NF]